LTESFSRIDTVINYWNGNQYYLWQPVSGYGNYYSVLWQGYVYIENSGNYGFGTISDDGSQVFIDSILIVDNGEAQWFDWEDNMGESDTSNSPFMPLFLDSGFHDISIRFYEKASYDGIELWWFKPSPDSSDIPYYGEHFHATYPIYNSATNWEIVPKSVLYTSLDSITSTRILDHQRMQPLTLKLLNNYPNPFNPETRIRYQVFNTTKPIKINISIYDILGQTAADLITGQFSSGIYELVWDGTNFPAGIYYCVLTSNNSSIQTIKLVLVK